MCMDTQYFDSHFTYLLTFSNHFNFCEGSSVLLQSITTWTDCWTSSVLCSKKEKWSAVEVPQFSGQFSVHTSSKNESPWLQHEIKFFTWLGNIRCGPKERLYLQGPVKKKGQCFLALQLQTLLEGVTVLTEIFLLDRLQTQRNSKKMKPIISALGIHWESNQNLWPGGNSTCTHQSWPPSLSWLMVVWNYKNTS